MERRSPPAETTKAHVVRREPVVFGLPLCGWHVNAKWPPKLGGHFTKKFGGVLLSHRVPPAVPSALRGLASGFGM